MAHQAPTEEHGGQDARIAELRGGVEHFAGRHVAETRDEMTEASHFGPKQYVIIGVILTLITVFELWLSYSGLADAVMITALFLASALKFAIVVAYFMHLRFDAALLTRLFVFAIALAGAIAAALIALFWTEQSLV